MGKIRWSNQKNLLIISRWFRTHSWFKMRSQILNVLFKQFLFRSFTNSSNIFKNAFFAFVLFSERWDNSWSFRLFLWKNDRPPGTTPSLTYIWLLLNMYVIVIQVLFRTHDTQYNNIYCLFYFAKLIF